MIKETGTGRYLSVASFRGLSTDTKPTNVDNGAEFLEIDTGDIYLFNEANHTWVKCAMYKPTDAQAEEYIGAWLDDHPEATTTVQDNSITDAKLVQSGGILSRVGKLLFEGTHSYAGGAENWMSLAMTGTAMKIAIRFPDNVGNVAIEVSANVSGWIVLATISDSKWHVIDVPSGASQKIALTYKGATAVTLTCEMIDVATSNLTKDVAELRADIDTIGTDLDELETKVDVIDQNIPQSLVTYLHSGYIDTSGTVVTNPDFAYSDYIDVTTLNRDVNIYWHGSVATFTFYDENKTYLNEYVKRTTSGAGMEEKTIDIPNDAVYVIVCTDPSYANKVYVYSIKTTISAIEDIVPTKANYGNVGDYDTVLRATFMNFTACPCKKADKAGKVESVFVHSESSATLKLYVGEVDQLYLFVPRKSYDVSVAAGKQTIDVSDRDIFINEGEQILIKFSGQTPFVTVTGTPEGDTSFYYSDTGTMQLQVYGAQKAVVFGFGYTVASSIDIAQSSQISDITDDTNALQNDVSTLIANFNVVSDRDGNKYKMIVQNGAIALLPMNFSHVLCVGNSYTIHPTTTDIEPDYANNLWWGHWSMAATDADTAWTKLLQNALRQKNNSAVVTPVFGRRYETDPATYTVTNSDTFTYWDGNEWQSLKDNVSDFSDVDAVVFFLGANYQGNDWYNLYSAMVNQFLTWFPNISLFCCSCAAFAMAEKDAAIQQVANEKGATYISMVGINGKSKIGSYVKGDDGTLHQVNNGAVAGHFGDLGEYLILNKLCNAMGYTNNTALYDISLGTISGVTLSVVSTKTVSGAIVSVFADIAEGTTLPSITVKDASDNSIAVTDHGTTDYGRVFTFVMPSSNVTVS